MDRKRLEATFRWKLTGELKLFKYRILQKEKEEIYNLSYRINSIICIYEILLELSMKLEIEVLEKCMEIPALLTYMYGKWLKTPDRCNDDMEYSIKSALFDLQQTVA